MAEAATARYREVFGVAEFRVLFAANLASILGDVVAAVALMVLVYQRTHSPGLASLTMSLVFIPYLFGGALLSAAVERWPARRTLVACHVASALLVAVMAAPGMPVAALLALLFAVGLFAPVFQGVRAALLPQVLPPGPPYVLGRSVMRLVSQSAQIIGYGAGGLLLLVLSARGALVIDAASFALSAALVRFGTAARPATATAASTATAAARGVTGDAGLGAGTGADAGAGRPTRPSMVRASLSGLRRVFAAAELRRVMLLGWAIPACTVAPEALAAAYVAHIHQPASAVGWYLASMPLGSVVADVVAGRMLGPRAQGRLVLPAALVASGSLAVFALGPPLPATIVVLFVVGLGFAYAPGLDQHLVEVAPGPLRDTALAVSSSGLMFVQGVGFAVWGFAAELASIRLVIPIAAGFGVMAALALTRPWPIRDRTNHD
jgi:MFS family permease